tara:strand:- start:56 stop:553 length:498 start_codon:yes stop_codon:yes gene_type:complete
LLTAFALEEGTKFAKYIFAMILMPVETDRKKLQEYVDGFHSVLGLFEENKSRAVLRDSYLSLIDKSKTYVGDHNKNPKWLDKNVSKVIRTLRVRSFFKRFSLPRICEFLDEMELQLIREKDILFFEADKVYVLVSGSILMKNHEASVNLPQTCAKFGDGAILNFL